MFGGEVSMANEPELDDRHEYCPDCNATVTISMKSEWVSNLVDERGNRIHDLDRVYHHDVYSFGLCAGCEAPFFFHDHFVGVEDRVLPECSEVLYPKAQTRALEDVPAQLVDAFEEGTRCFRAGNYNAAALMARRTVEMLCEIEDAEGRTLYNKLEYLKSDGKLDPTLLDWAHGVRLGGNDAAHNVTSSMQKTDASDLIELVEAILMYTYTLQSKFEAFRQRRETLDRDG
jgi:uncharacterized protein with PIN domain